MKGVKKEQAGLLWRLLPARSRKEISKWLSASELTGMTDAYEAYRKRKPPARARIELALRADITTKRSLYPGIAGVLLFLFSVLLFSVVSLPVVLRLQVFAPLGLGVGGAFALYLLEPWKLKYLFRMPPWSSLISVVIGTVLLIWLIYSIGELEPGGSFRMNRLLLASLLVGVASAPLAEEIFFRELLLRVSGSAAVGHCISVVLFAAVHMPTSLEMGVLYALSGAVLSVLRASTDTLSAPLAAHSAANTIVTLARFL